MRQPFIDLPASVYNDYYATQVGGTLPYFAGGRMQRGHGLGSLFGGLLRSVVPMVGRVLKKEVPRRLFTMGSDVLRDVSQGTSLGAAVKKRGLQQLKGAAQQFVPGLLGAQTNTPIHRGPPGVRANSKRLKRTNKKTRKRQKKDIFA